MAADVSRRDFLLRGAALGAGLAWMPKQRLLAGTRAAGNGPAGFPPGVDLYRQTFENWALEVRVDDVWTCSPVNAGQVAAVTNWAARNGWTVRPRGACHGWAPFTVLPGQDRDAHMVLLDTSHFNEIAIDKANRSVRVGAGVLMDDLMAALEQQGLGFSSIPAVGAITVGGAIAVNGHGAAMPARGEDPTGHSFSSLSNRVIGLTAVVWDAAAGKYAPRYFHRSEPVTKALIASLGRAFVTSVTLRAERNVSLRCRSYVDIPSDELFAASSAPGRRTFESFLDKTGRVETILFPGTDAPWLKTWEVVPAKPAKARLVTGPYNYPFSDSIPLPVARAVKRVMANEPGATQAFGRVSYEAASGGLLALNAMDLWGSARNTQHYIRPSTIRAAEFGWAILTSRNSVQRALHEFIGEYQRLVAKYAAKGLHPANMPVELRCTTVDDPSFVGVAGAEAPSLAATAPRPDHPEWDTCIWSNVLNLVGSEGDYAFKRDFEAFLVRNYSGTYASVRVEWSKGWAYTDQGGWSNQHIIRDVIPNEFRAGRNANTNWDWAVRTLRDLDPKNVFTNPFLDHLLQ